MPSRARRTASHDPSLCKVCTRANVEEIDAKLLANQGAGRLELEYRLSNYALRTHKAALLDADAQPAAPQQRRRREQKSSIAPLVQEPSPKPEPVAAVDVAAPQRLSDHGRDEDRVVRAHNLVHEILDDNDIEGVIERPPDVESRVQYIMGRMASARWHGPESKDSLARAWGVSKVTADTYAREASRRLSATSDPDTVVTFCSHAMALGIQRILDKMELGTTAGDVLALASITSKYADITGASYRRRKVIDRSDELTGLPPVLASLNPPPSVDELEEYCRTGILPLRQRVVA